MLWIARTNNERRIMASCCTVRLSSDTSVIATGVALGLPSMAHACNIASFQGMYFNWMEMPSVAGKAPHMHAD